MKINVKILLDLVPTTGKITGKPTESVKRKKTVKVHVKNPATLINIYYFTSIFEWISLGIK